MEEGPTWKKDLPGRRTYLGEGPTWERSYWEERLTRGGDNVFGRGIYLYRDAYRYRDSNPGFRHERAAS
jgi:hypothetical protein